MGIIDIIKSKISGGDLQEKSQQIAEKEFSPAERREYDEGIREGNSPYSMKTSIERRRGQPDPEYRRMPNPESEYKRIPRSEPKHTKIQYIKEPKQTKENKSYIEPPPIFKNIEETEAYLNSLPPKERYEMTARLKGFKNGAERSKAIEYVNRQSFQKGDAETAYANNHPEKVYKQTKADIKNYVRRVGVKAKELTTSRGIKKLAAGTAGSVIIALKGNPPGDIRGLKEVRKQLEQERLKEFAEKKIERQHELAIASALGGHPQYKQKVAPKRSMVSRIGVPMGGMNLGGFSLSTPQGVRSSQKQKVVYKNRPKIQTTQPRQLHPSNDNTGYNALFGNMNVGMESRPVVKTSARPKSYNPTNDPSGNFLVGMGNSGSNPMGNYGNIVRSPISSQKKSVGTPTKKKMFWET